MLKNGKFQEGIIYGSTIRLINRHCSSHVILPHNCPRQKINELLILDWLWSKGLSVSLSHCFLSRDRFCPRSIDPGSLPGHRRHGGVRGDRPGGRLQTSALGEAAGSNAPLGPCVTPRCSMVLNAPWSIWDWDGEWYAKGLDLFR